MNRKKLAVILAVVVLTAVAAITAVSALADNNNAQGADPAAVGISEDEASQAAEQAAGGTAGAVETETEDGTLVYEVKVGNQEVEVDGSTGQVIEVDDESADDESVEDDDGASEDDQSTGNADDQSETVKTD